MLNRVKPLTFKKPPKYAYPSASGGAGAHTHGRTHAPTSNIFSPICQQKSKKKHQNKKSELIAKESLLLN